MIRSLTASLIAIILLASSSEAQLLPLKRDATASGTPCPAVKSPPLSALPSTLTDSLLAAGSRAAILGDHQNARDLLEQATQLDPANFVASYRLARTLDDSGEYGEALREYCRYLSLGPTAADTLDVRHRVQQLALTGEG